LRRKAEKKKKRAEPELDPAERKRVGEGKKKTEGCGKKKGERKRKRKKEGRENIVV
jgi:hypothetical protein